MFKDRVILITGGSSGIGKTTAILFAERGADIALTYKNNKLGAEETVVQIIKLGRKAVAIRVDLTNDENARNVVREVVTIFGKIDILVNNAGRYINDDEWVGQMKFDGVRRMIKSEGDTSIKQRKWGGDNFAC